MAASLCSRSGKAMSRIGKKIIAIPSGVTVTVNGSSVSVKGPNGELSREFPDVVEIQVDGTNVTAKPLAETIEARALWGTVAAHLTNMVAGAAKPFEKKLEIQGIGYKAELRGNAIGFALGFSHPVEMPVPNGVKVTIEKGVITLTGPDKEVLGSYAARIRDLKKPEPYKGKGIRYVGEYVKIKQGKKSA